MAKDKPVEDAVVPARPSHIILGVEWGVYPSGKVLQTDDDLIASLDAAGVKYRFATVSERRIGGFPDQGE